MKPYLTALTVCSILAAVLAPPEAKVLSVLILFCVPGVAIVSFTFHQKDRIDQLILSVLAGLAFQIVYGYMISTVAQFSLLTLGLPSLICAAAFDMKDTAESTIDKKAFLIFIPALLFAGLTLNLVPGEDAIAHLLLINDITETAAVPQTYQLYPEIPILMYPLGFHIITAQLQLFSGVDNLIFNVASLLSGILCLSVYWCAKKLFSTECGLIAGTLSVFAALQPLRSVTLSNYSTLLAYIFTCAAVGIIAGLYKSSYSPRPYLLLSLMLAAAVETHLYFLVVLIPISVFLLKQLSQLKIKESFTPLGILGLSVLISLPFVVRVLRGYHLYQLDTLHSLQYVVEQEHHFFLQFTPYMIPQEIGVWITLIGVLGLILLDKYRILFGLWVGIFLFLAVNSVLKIEFPLWYAFFAPRMVDQLFLPFSILGAFFLVQMKRFSQAGVVFLFAILLVLGSSPLLKAPRADRGDLFPTISSLFEADQRGMIWLMNTDEDAVILNEWWTSTGSAWIPSLVGRRVVFPYSINTFSINTYSVENYVEALNLPQKERKNFIISAFPDTEEAHQYLQEWGVDYIFLSSYVLEESKWRSALWNPFILQESPNYQLVFNEEYTYIFRVVPTFEYSSVFQLKDCRSFTVNPETSETLKVSLDTLSFPVDKILDIYFEDEGWGQFEITAHDSTLAVIPLTNTNTTVHAAVRIPKDTEEVTISTMDQPVTMRVSVASAFQNSIKYDYNVALVGVSWEKATQGYQLMESGYIYVINSPGKIKITYVDTGEGNIDLNMLIKGQWEKLATIYRENDGAEKTILLELPEGYTLLNIGIKAWGDPFVLIEATTVGHET